ncbi:NSFL1 cofactor p47, variant 2 [Balamuthia mandrillaris]
MDRDRRSTGNDEEASLDGGSNDVFEVFQQAIAQVAEERRRARSQPTEEAEVEDDLSSLEGPVLDLTSATSSSSSSLSSHRQQESSSSNNLSSSTQAKLMQSLAALLQHTQQQQQAEDSPSASAALRLNSTKPKNGDRTPNKGPCPCGYRHWLDGQEYDHVFLLETDNGPTFLGFNHEDNPYAVATAFVARNNLNRGSINDTHLISTLANRIIEVTSTRSSSSASSPSLSSLSNDASSLSASDTSPFNTSSSSLSSLPAYSLSPEEEEEKRRRDHEARQQQYLEETKRRQAEEKERKREKERIRQQIKQARIDKEARQREEKRLEEELRKQRLESGDSSSSSASASSFSSPTSFSVAAEENQKENNRKEKWEDFMVTAYDDEEEDDEFYGRSEYRSRKDEDLLVDDPAFQQLLTQARATSKKQPTNSRFVTLNDIQSSNQASMDDVVPTPTTQKEWDLRMLSYKYGKLGEVGLVAALDKVGFKPTEIKGMLSLARILHTTSASSQQGRNAFSALASTRNSDLAPSSSLSSSSMNNPSSWFVGRGQTLGSEPEEEKKNNEQKNETETAVVTMAKQIVVDESQPQTSVMVRLHTGARLVIKCNHSHTVADLRSHIET